MGGLIFLLLINMQFDLTVIWTKPVSVLKGWNVAVTDMGVTTYADLRRQFWPEAVDQKGKLWGREESLRRTARTSP